MGKVIENEEIQKLKDKFASVNKRMESRRIVSDFIQHVSEGKVKNDGSDEFLSLVDEFVLNKNKPYFSKRIKKHTVMYRARIVDADLMNSEMGIQMTPEGISGFCESESREAPLGKAKEGRNNIIGTSFFYASSSPVTACCEVKPGLRQFVSVATFQTTTAMRVIDFSNDLTLENHEKVSLGLLFSEVMLGFCRPVTSVNEYKATQYLADYIRKAGYDGICYRSFFSNEGINFTIFNSDHRRIEFLESSLFWLQTETKSFMDLNGKNVYKATSVGDDYYEEALRLKIIDDIKYAVNRNNRLKVSKQE